MSVLYRFFRTILKFGALASPGLALALSLCVPARADALPKLTDNKPDHPIRIVTFGTSLTAVGGWQDDLQESLRACTGAAIEVVNLGQGRMASDWGLENIGRVIAERPDIVLIEFSINDAYVAKNISLSESENNNRAIIRKIRDVNKYAKIYLMTMNYTIGPIQDVRPDLDRYYEIYRFLAAKEAVQLIDNAPLWLARREAEPASMARLIPDSIHPTAEAFREVALPNVVRALTNDQCSK